MAKGAAQQAASLADHSGLPFNPRSFPLREALFPWKMQNQHWRNGWEMVYSFSVPVPAGGHG
jgi:hypothetical protein